MTKLPAPVTPQEAKRVWESQQRPSARTVSRALTQSGRPVHFTSVARWRSQGWRPVEHGEHPLDMTRRALDVAVPVLTGDPTTKAEDLVEVAGARKDLERLMDKELLSKAVREALITQILVHQEIQRQAEVLVATMPMETGVLIKALAASLEASTKAYEQVLVLRDRAHSR